MPFDAQEPAVMRKLVGNPSAKIAHTLTDIYLRTGRFSLRHFDFFQYVLMGTQKQMISHLKALKKSV